MIPGLISPDAMKLIERFVLALEKIGFELKRQNDRSDELLADLDNEA